MAVCPKCNKQVNDGAKFCDNCGARILETINCPNCGKQISAEAAFCEYCGAAISNNVDEQKAETKELMKVDVKKEKRKIPNKKILFGGIGIALTAAIILVVLLFIRKGNSNNNYALYIKDNEIFYTDFSEDEPLQLTTELVYGGNDGGNEDLANASYYLSSLNLLSDDGNIMFFVDRIDVDDDGFSLYYRHVNKPDQEAEKIDSDVISYAVNKQADLVTYIKGCDGILYQYNMKTGDKEKIDSNVSRYNVSDDGKKVVYINDDGAIYQKNSGEDKEKIDSDVSEIIGIRKDFSTIYYEKEDELYRKSEGEDKVKIASDVSSVINVYDSGEIYYIKADSQEVTLMDYVEDDMKDANSSITEPEYPDYPYWWDYDAVEEYDAAYEQYESEYAAYEEAYELYLDKTYRDEIRYSLENNTMTLYSYTLCYYDGAEEKVLSDTLAYDRLSDDFAYSYAAGVPVIAYRSYNQSSFDKVKLSKITDVYDVEQMVNDALYSSSEQFIVIGDDATALEQDSAMDFNLEYYGNTVYYIDNVNDDNTYGELYKITISDGKVQEPEEYDSDVYVGYTCFTADGKFMYFKDVKDGMGDLYINKKKVDYDVKIDSVIHDADNDRIVYLTDWDNEKKYGTLKLYENNKASEIADEVYTVSLTPTGDILYLYDYSTNHYEGDLYIYKDGKAEKIDEEVVAIISVVGGRYRSLLY